MVVREDSLTLFGFVDDDEKQTFELVQTASGVGPKVAQSMLAVLVPGRPAPRDRRRRHQDADPGARHRPEGRPADRARAQGPHRRARPASATRPPPSGEAPWRDQVHQGLVGLGWPVRDAEKAVDAVAPEAGDVPDVAALLRAALRTLSKA